MSKPPVPAMKKLTPNPKPVLPAEDEAILDAEARVHRAGPEPDPADENDRPKKLPAPQYCPSEKSGTRCAFEKGHPGLHASAKEPPRAEWAE